MDDLATLSAIASATRVASIADGVVLCEDGRRADPLASVGELMTGDEILVCSVAGRERAVVIGRIGAPRAAALPDPPPAEVVIAAGSALALRCGASAITLRADGRILIDGLDIASRAKRLNRIAGGAVAIN